jgi:hypothetical protein
MSQFPKARPTKVAPRKRAPRSVKTHVMQTNGQTDHAGTPICAACGHLASHRIHDLYLPEGSVEVADRIVGEGQSD